MKKLFLLISLTFLLVSSTACDKLSAGNKTGSSDSNISNSSQNTNGATKTDVASQTNDKNDKAGNGDSEKDTASKTSVKGKGNSNQKLTDAQIKEISDINAQMTDLKKQMVDKLAGYGTISKEQADKLKAELDQELKNINEKSFQNVRFINTWGNMQIYFEPLTNKQSGIKNGGGHFPFWGR